MVVDQEGRAEDSEEEDPADDYWEKRYTMVPQNIPTFLQHHATVILRTGKYLNVIRQSGEGNLGRRCRMLLPRTSTLSTSPKGGLSGPVECYSRLLLQRKGHITSRVIKLPLETPITLAKPCQMCKLGAEMF